MDISAEEFFLMEHRFARMDLAAWAGASLAVARWAVASVAFARWAVVL